MRALRRTRFLAGLLLLSLAGAVAATPRMALIIDDLGDRADLDFQVADLPVRLTCAILPHTPHATRLAERCTDSGKEVMLHLPLQAESYNELLGPGRLELDMDEPRFRGTFQSSLASVPGVRGVNNHMGSLLTRHPGAMTWLMEELDSADLFFVDSRTTSQSVAMAMAREQSVPAAERDIFLDAKQDTETIEAQLDRAIRIAHQTGQVVVIGHPYPETIEVLQRRLPSLELETGIELTHISSLLHANDDNRGGETDEQAGTDSPGGRLRGTGSGHDD